MSDTPFDSASSHSSFPDLEHHDQAAMSDPDRLAETRRILEELAGRRASLDLTPDVKKRQTLEASMRWNDRDLATYGQILVR